MCWPRATTTPVPSDASPAIKPASPAIKPASPERSPDLACAVCLEEYNDRIMAVGGVHIVVFTKCKHMFCASCYYGMKTNRCPLCRSEGSAAHFTMSVGAGGSRSGPE